jgi:hypothetical protein
VVRRSVITANSSGPEMSGGASCTTGRTRSSMRAMRLSRNRGRGSRSRASDSSRENVPSSCGPSRVRGPRSTLAGRSPTIGAGDGAQLLDEPLAGAHVLGTCSRPKASRFAKRSGSSRGDRRREAARERPLGEERLGESRTAPHRAASSLVSPFT